MSYTPALDVSQWQGYINWAGISEPIVIIKFSGGDAGLYVDSKANQNYYGAKAAGKAVGMYHFLGTQEPEAEAEYFRQRCSPFDENDVIVVDVEAAVANLADCVERVRRFNQYLIDAGAPIPLAYMNTNTENRYDWSPVINQNVGLWVADYRYGPDDNVPIRHWPTYIMHQFNSSPIDHDAFFGSVDQFKAYGWHQAKLPNPEPAPVDVPPTPPPAPTPAPITEPAPVVTPTPLPVTPAPVDDTNAVVKENNNLLKQILQIVKDILTKLTGIFK
jgi:lysozyme